MTLISAFPWDRGGSVGAAGSEMLPQSIMLLIYQLLRVATRHKLFLQLKREGQAVLKHAELRKLARW